MSPPGPRRAGPTNTWPALRDPDTRKRIREEVASGFGRVQPRFDTWVISDVKSGANQDVVGRSIAAIAADRGIEPAEAVLQLEEEERGAVSAVVHGRVERDTRYFLAHPLGMVSSDGNAISPTGVHAHKQVHPRFYGTYPRILGRNVREQSLMSLETAIEKMTSMPADRLNLKDRGRVGVGQFADLVAFDPGVIIDHSTFEKPHQLSEGVLHLLVRGEAVISGARADPRPARSRPAPRGHGQLRIYPLPWGDLCTTVIPAKAGIQRGGGLARMVSFTTPDVASSGRLRKGLLTGEGLR